MSAVDLPDRIHRYRILEEIGRGSMGRVFLAEDPNTDRRIALKVLAPQFLAEDDRQQELQQRFLFEGKAVGRLNHPGIVTVYDADADPDTGLPYLAMEYVEGRSLRQLLDASQPPSPRTLVGLLAQVARALDEAHRREVVHRDIKPANLLVTAEGRVKVVDFGIAKMVSPAITLPGRTVGTPFYMSPEQVRGHVVDGRTDLYSLGVVLYECIAGEPPFSGDDIANIQYNIVNSQPVPAKRRVESLDRRLAKIVARALEKEPRKRFQRGEAFAAALETVVDQDRGPLWIPSAARRRKKSPAASDGDSDGLGTAESAAPQDFTDVEEARSPPVRQGRRRHPWKARRRDRWIAGILFTLILTVLFLSRFELPALRDEAPLATPDLSSLGRPDGDANGSSEGGNGTTKDSEPQPSDGAVDGVTTNDVPAEPRPTDGPTVPPTSTNGAADGSTQGPRPSYPLTTLEVQFRNFLAEGFISLWVDGEKIFTEHLGASFWKRNFASGEDFRRLVPMTEGRHSIEVHVSKTRGRSVEARKLIYADFPAGRTRVLQVVHEPASSTLVLTWQDEDEAP